MSKTGRITIEFQFDDFEDFHEICHDIYLGYTDAIYRHSVVASQHHSWQREAVEE